MANRLLTTLILLLASGIGLWAFLSPFLQGVPEEVRGTVGGAHAGDALWLFLLLLGLCLLVIISSLEVGRMDSRLLAALGLLVGINATLRLLSGPAGVNAIFFLPILCGFVFGAEFGFLLGSLSTLVSGLITGGIGPWLPFQMFTAGWGGMVAGWFPTLGRSGLGGRERLESALLAGWGAFSGLLFGAVMNLWFWPFLIAPVAGGSGGPVHWQPGLALGETLRRYITFYLTTSLWWDFTRGLGTAFLLLIAGPPVLRLLRRFQKRLHFIIEAGAELPPSLDTHGSEPER